MAANRNWDAAGDVKAGANYTVWRTARWTPREFAALAQEEQFKYLALCAHLAPSSHNT